MPALSSASRKAPLRPLRTSAPRAKLTYAQKPGSWQQNTVIHRFSPQLHVTAPVRLNRLLQK